VANLQGGFDVRGQHTYNKAGSFPFSVTIDGPGGISASPIATAKVIALTATAGSIVTTPGQTFNGQVAYIRCTDPDSIKGEFSATIAWGDGTTSAGTITSVSKGSFNVNGLNRYFTAGSYSFMVTIRGPGGSSTTASGTAEVLALGTTGANLQTIPGQLFNDVVATFSSTSPLSVPGDFTATISWGDGLTSRGIIEPRTQGVFAVRGQHLYRQVGTYSILVAIHGPNDSLVRARSTAALAGWADDFQRPNSDFLARPWEETSGRWTINNNSLVAMDPGSNLAVVTGAPLTDGSVQVDFTLGSSSASYVGLVSRNASPGNLYLGEIMAVNGTYTAYLFRCLGGTWTQLATAPVGNSSGALRLENVGTSLKLFLDGQLLVYAFDSNLANGLAGVGASGGTRLDDFVARAIYLNQVTLPFGDTFSQATGSSLSRSWVEQQGNFSVQAGGLRANDPGVNLATVNQVPTSDMAVEASLVLGSAGWGGVVAALSGPGQSNMYGAILSRSASSYKVTLFRNRGGSWVELASAAAGADNGRLRLEVAGKTLKLSFNGNLVATVQVDQPLGPGQAGLWSGSGTLFSDFQVS
jgi:hypothetical protein